MSYQATVTGRAITLASSFLPADRIVFQNEIILKRLVMYVMVSFCAVLFPRDVLDEILDLTESVSEGFMGKSISQSLVAAEAVGRWQM